MSSQADYEAALTQAIREGRAVIVAGTGVSMAASFDATTQQPHPQACWTGLLENGLKWLKDHSLIDDDVAEAQLKLLKRNPQTHRFVSAAEDVTAGMGGTQSAHFADWLKRTVGAIQVHDASVLDALDAIRQHGNLLATTNYDGLLLGGRSQLAPVTWRETDALIGVARTWDIDKIIYLHGHWRQPESVILDWKSYDKIARDEQYREDLTAFWRTNIWVYVGCGVNGLTDPDFGLLLERYGQRARHAGHWDYCLVRDNQRDEFQAYFDTNHLNIRAIPFGRDHGDLASYLYSLLPALAASPPIPALPASTAPTDAALALRASRIRSRYLKDARQDFEARLAASVHHARFIDLGIQDDPAAIKPAWGYHNPETTQSYDTIAEAFSSCDRRLLLLGSPGSGKTTALLHLAQLLAHQAEQDPNAPIPFVVNLSKFSLAPHVGKTPWPNLIGRGGFSASKTDDDDLGTKFEDWLVSEMATFPALTHEMARDWIHQGRVAALLDGLDEFNDDRRADLARLLNKTFLRFHPALVVVVCSRTNEYHALRGSEETRLQLRGCVHLQPLSDPQIAAYLAAARATALLSALPDDPSLHELAKTPLTLSMLVLAYGGLAPSDLPRSGSPSESRHQLFEAYVARMLQRRERRKRQIPFDSAKQNDVPLSEYTYHPDRLHRWLGWLALVLSVRMRTSFSPASFHTILCVGLRPARQPFNFVASYSAICPLLLLSLSLIAFPIVPHSPSGVLNASLIAASLVFLLPLAAAGRRGSPAATHFFNGSIVVVVVYDCAVLTRLVCSASSGAISPWPVGMAIPFAALILALGADGGFDDELKKVALWFLGGAGVATGLQLLPFNWRLFSLDRAWWQAIFVGLSVGLACAIHFMEFDPLRARLIALGCVIGTAAAFALVASRLPEPGWMAVFVSIGASSMLVLAVAEVSAGILLLVGSSLFALTGGVISSYQGAAFGSVLFGLLCAIVAGWYYPYRRPKSGDGLISKRVHNLDPNAIGRLVAHGQLAAAWAFRVLDRMLLSPCLWRIAAAGQRFGWRRDRLLSFCKDTFLLKQSAREYEFIHRLLRDYFALRELRPRLYAADSLRRLEAIRFLGYQGEAALDVLMELAEGDDPSVRAAALAGLGHISSPIVTRCLADHLDDRNTLVRQAIIPGLFRLPEADAKRLLWELKPLGDGCELDPLLDYLRTGESWRFIEEIRRVVRRLGESVMDPLRNCLRSRKSSVRSVAMDALAQFVGRVEQQLLSRDIDGGPPWLDPAEPIFKARVAQCARHLRLKEDEVLVRYRALAGEFGLKIKL